MEIEEVTDEVAVQIHSGDVGCHLPTLERLATDLTSTTHGSPLVRIRSGIRIASTAILPNGQSMQTPPEEDGEIRGRAGRNVKFVRILKANYFRWRAYLESNTNRPPVQEDYEHCKHILLRRVWPSVERVGMFLIHVCLLLIGVIITNLLLCIIASIVILLYRIPVALIFEGILSLKGPPTQQHLISVEENQHGDEVSDHQRDIIHKLCTFYDKRNLELAEKTAMKVLLVTLLLTVFISLGIIKGRMIMVLGFHLWKWMLLLAVFTCGRQITTLILAAVYHVPRQNKDMAVVRRFERGQGSRIICYYVYWLTDPIIAVFYLATLLLIWLQFFVSSSDLSYSYTTWTFICLLIGSVLLLVKTAFLLKWSEINVYNLFSERIVRGGFQLYFLALICGSNLSILHLARNEYTRRKMEDSTSGEPRIRDILMDKINGVGYRCSPLPLDVLMIVVQNIGQSVQKLLLDNTVPKHANLYDLRDIAHCFQDLALVSSDDHNYKDEDIDGLEQRFKQIVPENCRYVIKNDLETLFRFEEADATLFWQQLLLQHLQDNPSQCDSPEDDASPSQDSLSQDSPLQRVSYESFINWMVNVHIHSISLGRTLRDAEGLVNYLNSIINIGIAIGVILAWLILTKAATTQVLLVIASPIIAAALIYGDLCKRLFEGIVFIFVSHPFAVGDKCEIANIQLEVKEMGVLRTKFYKGGTREEISYSNSELASTPIMNLREDVGLDDQVTLNLDSSTASESAIEVMKTKITSFFNNDLRRRYASTTDVKTLNMTGDCTIMTIKFKHLIGRHDETFTKFLEIKRKQKSEFLHAVEKMRKETHINLAVAQT